MMSSIGGKPPKPPEEQAIKSSATNSSTLNDPEPPKVKTGKAGSTRVPAAGTAGSKPASASLLAQLPNFIQKRLAEFLAATPGGVKNLTETERALYFLLRHGIEAAKLETIQPPTDDEDSKKTYQQAVNKARNPVLSARIEIAAGFTSKIALYLEEKCGITPQEFHDIMGREFFLARDINKPKSELIRPEETLAYNLDYARHIADAFDLADFVPDDTTQNIEALLKVDLTTIDPNELKRHFDNQKRTVEAIRDCKETGETRLDFGIHPLYDDLQALRIKIRALPPHIGELAHLTHFSLSQNRIRRIPVELGKLVNLIHLELPKNEIREIPAEIGKLVNLIHLDLSENEIRQIPVEIEELEKLSELNLSRNEIDNIPAVIGKLLKLERLILEQNQLTSLPSEIGKLRNLLYLFLRFNQISALPVEIGNLKELVTLHLQFNKLSTLPTEIGQLENLVDLDLSHNQLEKLPVEIGALSRLCYLYLHDNQLTTLPAEMSKLGRLEQLRIGDNPFTANSAFEDLLKGLETKEPPCDISRF